MKIKNIEFAYLVNMQNLRVVMIVWILVELRCKQKTKLMTSIIELKTSKDEQEVEYEVSSLTQEGDVSSIATSLQDIEERIRKNEDIMDDLNVDINRLTNNADIFDYTVAISSGLLTGMIDAFFVGEFNIVDLKADANKHVNKFIEKYAKLRGYKENGQGLKGAISFLEGKFPVDQDNVWKGLGISSTKLHHLEDIAHHPTILGLVASIAVCFFRTAIFVDDEGKWHFVLLETGKKDEVGAVLLREQCHSNSVD